ncbi:hypothetical protein TSUD_274200 [Trifolium subterraneum]|uniref:Reverse transcriptase zinc-binding domain-containing protein n=1 Tax=Trifolium subterraneum TaxID=3900 RepID=A0A2Z6P031_TRISU|nr:hypothetical protein TSUD_274200 [Trifolium subterraneum]
MLTSREEWGRIWKIHTPPKAKHFLWRVCKECLPTRIRLRSRHVQCPIECPLCLEEPEDEGHIFFNCGSIKEAWSAMGVDHILYPRMSTCHDIRDFIFQTCCNDSKQIAGKMALLLWTIWQNRNNMVWNNIKHQARQIGTKAAQAWNEWAMIHGLLEEQQRSLFLPQHTAPTSQQHDAPAAIQWQPPHPGYLRCNADASFYNADGKTGWGWCLWDHRGRFILASTNLINGRLTTLEGEAMAIKEAICETSRNI